MHARVDQSGRRLVDRITRGSTETLGSTLAPKFTQRSQTLVFPATSTNLIRQFVVAINTVVGISKPITVLQYDINGGVFDWVNFVLKETNQ